MARSIATYRSNNLSKHMGQGYFRRQTATEARLAMLAREQAEMNAYYEQQEEQRYQDDKAALEAEYDAQESVEDRRKRLKRESAARSRAKKKALLAA